MFHIKLAYQLSVITVVMYLLRPIEAIVCATISGCKSFYETFKDKMWYYGSSATKELYKVCIKAWKESE